MSITLPAMLSALPESDQMRAMRRAFLELYQEVNDTHAVDLSLLILANIQAMAILCAQVRTSMGTKETITALVTDAFRASYETAERAEA